METITVYRFAKLGERGRSTHAREWAQIWRDLCQPVGRHLQTFPEGVYDVFPVVGILADRR